MYVNKNILNEGFTEIISSLRIGNKNEDIISGRDSPKEIEDLLRVVEDAVSVEISLSKLKFRIIKSKYYTLSNKH